MDLEMTNELTATLDRLAAAASLLQQAAERLTERENTFTLDAEARLGSRREAELEQQLATAEVRIAELRASVPATVTHSGRKTLPAATINLLAKQGVSGDTIASMEAGALDAALISLSLEQRIAVKSQLMRAGLLG